VKAKNKSTKSVSINYINSVDMIYDLAFCIYKKESIVSAKVEPTSRSKKAKLVWVRVFLAFYPARTHGNHASLQNYLVRVRCHFCSGIKLALIYFGVKWRGYTSADDTCVTISLSPSELTELRILAGNL
jgi:hypothetical protein